MMCKYFLFSNIKAVLIILVVIGHFIEASRLINHNLLGEDLYKFIYSFHMAVFLFVSGYFSIDVEKGYNSAFSKCLLPYVVMILFTYIVKILFYGKASFSFFYPSFASWFLLTLFFYRIFLPILIKIKHIVLISILFSLLIGCSNVNLSLLSLGRTIAFLPFFLFGFYFKERYIQKIKEIYYSIIIGIILLYGAIFYFILDNISTRKIFYFKHSYHSMKFSNLEGVMIHGLIMILGFLAIIIFIKIIPNKQCFCSYIGDRTLSIYVLHPFFFFMLKKYNILNNGSDIDYLYCILISIFVVWLLSREIIFNSLKASLNFFSIIFLDTKKEKY